MPIKSAIRGSWLAGLVMIAFCTPFAQANAQQERKAPRDAMLLLHAGGFFYGDPSFMDEAAIVARQVGFKPVAVEYTLGDVRQAVRDAKRAAGRQLAQGREVYAYGESSGGTLAALLAQDGLVEAASAYAPIADLKRWEPAEYLDATDRQLRRASPARDESVRRILNLIPEKDEAVNSRHTERWTARDPLVFARDVPGEHGFTGTEWYPENLHEAMLWLNARAGGRG